MSSIYVDAGSLTTNPNNGCCPDGLIVDIQDFERIADVVNNCTIDRLSPHILEAQELHLSNKIGWGLLDEIIEFPCNECFGDLMCGSTFEYCGKIQKHFGLKRVLIHYAYGLYKYSNNYVDTTYGTVYKQVADSVPVDEKVLKRLRDEHFNLANEYWKGVEMYLCANKEKFTEFDDCNCECECNDCDDKTATGQGRLRRVRTFKKYGNNMNKKKCNNCTDSGCNCKKIWQQ